MKAVIGEYRTYVSWTYTLNPKTKKQREVNRNLLALFGDIGKIAVELMKKDKKRKKR